MTTKYRHEPCESEDQTYTVYGLDVWGHAPEDCEDAEDERQEDCCGFTVNDRSRVGKVTIRAKGMRYNVGTPHEFVSFTPETSDIHKALVEGDFLRPEAMIDVDGDSDGMLTVDSSTGRPLLQLERTTR